MQIIHRLPINAESIQADDLPSTHAMYDAVLAGKPHIIYCRYPRSALELHKTLSNEVSGIPELGSYINLYVVGRRIVIDRHYPLQPGMTAITVRSLLPPKRSMQILDIPDSPVAGLAHVRFTSSRLTPLNYEEENWAPNSLIPPAGFDNLFSTTHEPE